MNYQQSYSQYPGYSHPGYPVQPQQVRPATVTGAAVVGFVASGFEIIGGFVWLLGGSVIGDLESATEQLGGESQGVGAIVTMLAVASLIAAGCYIWGGVSALGGKSRRVLFGSATAAVVINLIAVIATGGAGTIGLVLAVVVIGLLLASASRAAKRA